MGTTHRLGVILLWQLLVHCVAAAPSLQAVLAIGGSQWDAVRAVTTDADGYIYIAGETYSTDFPGVGSTGYARSSIDAFVTKLSPTGSTLIYTVVFGGSGPEFARGIAVDANGNVYVTGGTTSADFPTTAGAFQRKSASPGLEDVFIVKLSPTGAIAYATYLGGSGSDSAYAIAIDTRGQAYVAGSSISPNFPTSATAPQSAFQGGGSDCFVAALDPTGGALSYATYLGGEQADICRSIAVDHEGNAVTTGTTNSSKFPVLNALQPTSSGGYDAFVTKISAAGDRLVFSTYFGSACIDEGNVVRLDSRGTIYVGGHTNSSPLPASIVTAQKTPGGDYDGFICAISGDGTRIVFATYFGGGGPDSITGLAIAPDGRLVAAGSTASTDLPAVSAFQTTFGGMLDAFVAVIDPARSSLDVASYLGGAGDDRSHGVAVLPNGRVVFGGQMMPDGLPSMDRRFSKTAVGQYDGFVAIASYTDPPQPLRFVPVTPCRVADTRNSNGPYGGPWVAGGSVRNFAVPGSACGIPTAARAYSVNVAVIPAGPLGYVTLWPAGQPQPVASTVNSLDGRVKSNATIVPAGTGGTISVFASNSTHIVLDINGYFVPATDPTALSFYPIAPCRLVDTRQAAGALGGPSLVGGQKRTFPIRSASACNIPPTAQAYSLNFAAVPKGPLGYLTAWPSGQSQPVAAVLTAPTATVTAGAALLPAGAGGAIDVFASNAADIIIDVNGYFAPPSIGGLSLYSTTPCRVLDTRQTSGQPFLGNVDVLVGGGACGAPAAGAYVLSATVVPTYALGYLSLWADGWSQPNAATLNALDGAVTSNLAVVPAVNGTISAFSSNHTHLVLDLVAYFSL